MSRHLSVKNAAVTTGKLVVTAVVGTVIYLSAGSTASASPDDPCMLPEHNLPWIACQG